MRIASGKASGISLAAPKGDTTRPATDAARLAIFSSLAGDVNGARVLDLFAGTGAYGLEALSLGARSACFVEKDKNAVLCIRKNISAVSKALGEICNARIISADCFSLRKVDPADIVFADPPYDLLRDPRTSAKIFDLFKLISGENPDTLFVLEAPAEFELSEAASDTFTILKRFGKKSRGKPSQILMRLNLSA